MLSRQPVKLAALVAKVEQLRGIVSVPDFGLESWQQVTTLGAEIREGLVAILLNDESSAEWDTAYGLLRATNRLYGVAVNQLAACKPPASASKAHPKRDSAKAR